MIDRIKSLLPDWLLDGGATSEDDTERDGFLSYSAEVHAVGHGLYDGLTSKPLTAGELPDYDDVQQEPHYYKGAYVVGTLLQVCIVLGILAAVALVATVL